MAEWGAEYQANVRQAKVFAAQMEKKAGVPHDVMKIFASPMGFRLLHALRGAVAEPGFVGGCAAREATKPRPRL